LPPSMEAGLPMQQLGLPKKRRNKPNSASCLMTCSPACIRP
jgi:hypothetical protein